MCCDNENVLWEQQVVVPLGADGKTVLRTKLHYFSSAPKLEALSASFNNESNLAGIPEYCASWASGDMERLLGVLAPGFTLSITSDGETSQVARGDMPAYYETSRKKVNLMSMCSFLIYCFVQLEERGGPDSSYADYRKIKKMSAKEVIET